MHKLYAKNTLNINSLKHLSHHLGSPIPDLQKIAALSEQNYKFYLKKKANGNFREICDPNPQLKKIQKSIHRLLIMIKASNCAHGGVKEHSNYTNALPHCKNRYLFKLDLKDFYPNISHRRVYTLFCKELSCAPEVASLLTKLSTVKGHVPQGGSMSTDIANLVLRKTDFRLENLANKYSIKYTRFVDDISFSGNTMPLKFMVTAKKIVLQSGFILNSDKEKLLDNSNAKTVTGLGVNRKKPNIPRSLRRQVRKEDYLISKFESKQLNQLERIKEDQRINGKKAYIDFINKNNLQSKNAAPEVCFGLSHN